MSAVLLMAIGAVWLSLGVLLWTRFLRRRIERPILRWIVLFSLLSLWMVGPWIDEILGAREFTRLCDELPSIKFYGPVAVGPGVFFSDRGEPTFSSNDDLSNSLTPYGKEFDRLFVSRDEWKQVASFPIPVFDNPTTWYDARNGHPVVTKPYRASPGGWIRRITGWGSHAPLVCPVRGTFPSTSEWVRFER